MNFIGTYVFNLSSKAIYKYSFVAVDELYSTMYCVFKTYSFFIDINEFENYTLLTLLVPDRIKKLGLDLDCSPKFLFHFETNDIRDYTSFS